MRALIINGSARGAKGVTAKLAGALADGLERGGGLGGQPVRGGYEHRPLHRLP